MAEHLYAWGLWLEHSACLRQISSMQKTIPEQEVVDQERFEQAYDERRYQFTGLTEFLDYVEIGVRAFVREMLQTYAEDEFMRYIGARPWQWSWLLGQGACFSSYIDA